MTASARRLGDGADPGRGEGRDHVGVRDGVIERIGDGGEQAGLRAALPVEGGVSEAGGAVWRAARPRDRASRSTG